MHATLNIGAVILASGEGRRFREALLENAERSLPSFYKLLTDFHGRPLIESVIDTVSVSAFCKSVVVTRSEDVHALCRRRQMPCLLHQMPHRRDTIRLGLDSLLREMNGDLDGCVFFQGDQPLVTPESIKAMILAFQQDHRSIYRLAYQGKPGSPVLFPRACFDELMHLPSHSGGSLVIRNHPELTRTVEARSPYELLDVDTPDALQYLRKLSI